MDQNGLGGIKCMSCDSQPSLVLVTSVSTSSPWKRDSRTALDRINNCPRCTYRESSSSCRLRHVALHVIATRPPTNSNVTIKWKQCRHVIHEFEDYLPLNGKHLVSKICYTSSCPHMKAQSRNFIHIWVPKPVLTLKTQFLS